MTDPPTIELSRRVLAAARAAGLRLGTAESCTGGMVAAALTDPAGASDAFDVGLVTYANEAKTELLGVPAPLILDKGAVSEEVALAMVTGLLERHPPLGAGVAVTGIAGPGGGSAEKPVGLVYIASARRGASPACRRHLFQGDRAAIRNATVSAALTQLLAALRSPPLRRRAADRTPAASDPRPY